MKLGTYYQREDYILFCSLSSQILSRPKIKNKPNRFETKLRQCFVRLHRFGLARGHCRAPRFTSKMPTVFGIDSTVFGKVWEVYG